MGRACSPNGNNDETSTATIIGAAPGHFSLNGKIVIDRVISRKEAALILGVSAKSLANWAVEGKGPKFIKHAGRNGRVGYRLSDIYAYIDSRTRTSTSDPGPQS